MNKLKKNIRHIDWKEFRISMMIFLAYFTIVAVIMIATGTWSLLGKEIIGFYSIGIIISVIINIAKQIK